jgi:hypothetical protein
MTDPRRSPSPEAVEASLLRFAAERGPDKTFSPADVARDLGGPHPDGWSPLMTPVRRVAIRLMREGRLVILRKGRPVEDPEELKGVYRLAAPRPEGSDAPDA